MSKVGKVATVEKVQPLGSPVSAAMIGKAIKQSVLAAVVVLGWLEGCSAPSGAADRLAAPDVRLAPSTAVELPAPITIDVGRRPPRVVLSELLPDPLLRDEGAGDYVEIANLATASVRLADLALVLPSGKKLALERPRQPWLLAGEVVVIQSAEAPGRIRLKGLRLANSAGRLELWWRSERIDVAQWQRRRPWPRAKPGVALERVSPLADGSSPAAWRLATAAVDRLERGSPGAVAWPCATVAGTPLARSCLAAPSRRPRACTR